MHWQELGKSGHLMWPSMHRAKCPSQLVEWLKDPTRQANELLGAIDNSLPLLECLLVRYHAAGRILS